MWGARPDCYSNQFYSDLLMNQSRGFLRSSVLIVKASIFYQ